MNPWSKLGIFSKGANGTSDPFLRASSQADCSYFEYF